MVPGFCSTVEALAPGASGRSKAPPAAVAVCGAWPLLTQVTVSPARAVKVAGVKPASVTITVCLPGLPGAAATAAGTVPAATGGAGGPATGGGTLPEADGTMTVPFIPPWNVQL